VSTSTAPGPVPVIHGPRHQSSGADNARLLEEPSQSAVAAQSVAGFNSRFDHPEARLDAQGIDERIGF
jgi:hypothetical protein